MSKDKKTVGQELEKELTYKKRNFFEVADDEKIKKAYDYAENLRPREKRSELPQNFARRKDIKNIVSEINSKRAVNTISTTETKVSWRLR